MKIKCKYCAYEWEYHGEKKITATCPDCLNKTPIKEAIPNEDKQSE